MKRRKTTSYFAFSTLLITKVYVTEIFPSYLYTESGLTHVWLANGFTLRKSKFGPGVSIHNVDGLHRALARALSQKPLLTGTEVRFLRKEMGMSQHGLGELLGVTGQTVALWERKGRLPKSVDRLLRLIYVEHDKGNTPIAGSARSR